MNECTKKSYPNSESRHLTENIPGVLNIRDKREGIYICMDPIQIAVSIIYWVRADMGQFALNTHQTLQIDFHLEQIEFL